MHSYFVSCNNKLFAHEMLKWLSRMQGAENLQLKCGADKVYIRFEAEKLHCIPHLIYFIKNHTKKAVSK